MNISIGRFDGDEENGGYGEYDDYYHGTRTAADELSRFAGAWVRHVLGFCRARVLKLRVSTRKRRLQIPADTVPLVSAHLTTVDLADVSLSFESLDFSGCPALEDLKMSTCKVYVDRVVSPSLRRLSVVGCNVHRETRTRIACPRLVSLQLLVCTGRVPVLEEMPVLVEADVWLVDNCADVCKHMGYDSSGNSCDRCDGSNVLLEGLSGVTSLVLTGNPTVFIFRKACKFGTTFDKLKILLLNEWCMAADSDALGYFLQSAPILEKLTLELGSCKTQDAVVVRDANNRFLASEHLKAVEIKCHEENILVKNVTMILRSYGVLPEKISVEETDSYPADSYGCNTTDSSDNEYSGRYISMESDDEVSS